MADNSIEEIRVVSDPKNKVDDNPLIRHYNITHFLQSTLSAHPSPEANLIHGVPATLAIDIVRCLRDWQALVDTGVQFAKLLRELNEMKRETESELSQLKSTRKDDDNGYPN